MSSPDSEAPRRRALRWAAILVALALPPLLVRGFLFEVYAIQSDSMEPSFVAGDQLLVLRSGADPRDLQRWDVTLVDRAVEAQVPDGIDALIKRIVGLPGEWLRIEGGDVWLRANGEPEDAFAIARKDDALVASLLVPVEQGRGLSRPWEVREGNVIHGPEETFLYGQTEPAVVAFDAPVLDGFPGRPGSEPVADTAVWLELGKADGVLEVQLQEGADVYVARLAPAGSGGASLHHNLTGVVDRRPGFEGLTPGSKVMAWNVDNGVRVFVDDDLILAWDYERNEPIPPGAQLRNEPRLMVEAGAIEIVSSAVLRDLHYTSQGIHGTDPAAGLTPVRVPPGHVFVLGDSSRESRDGRFFGPVSIESLRGRPMAIYRPWERARWLGVAETGR
jgi:signal peptidase I